MIGCRHGLRGQRWRMTQPKLLDAAEVLSALESGRPTDLIGARETQAVEFKAERYRLEDERQKFELAKDVSALANSVGGVIVIGIRTRKADTHSWDTAAETSPVPSAMVDEESMRKVIASWVYPTIEGLQIARYTTTYDDRVLASIFVPQQPASSRPFVVVKVVNDGERSHGAQLAYYVRRDDDARPLSAQEVQSILRDGMVLRRVLDERTRDGASGSDTGLGTSVPMPSHRRPADLTSTRVEALADATELLEVAMFSLTATPEPDVDATGILAAENHPLNRAVQQAPELRASGFDLDALGPHLIHEGRCRRSIMQGYKGREFWSDGTLIFVAVADENFLSWGERKDDQPLTINPVPLVESTFLFCKLAEALYGLVPNRPTQVAYTLHLNRM